MVKSFLLDFRQIKLRLTSNQTETDSLFQGDQLRNGFGFVKMGKGRGPFEHKMLAWSFTFLFTDLIGCYVSDLYELKRVSSGHVGHSVQRPLPIVGQEIVPGHMSATIQLYNALSPCCFTAQRM